MKTSKILMRVNVLFFFEGFLRQNVLVLFLFSSKYSYQLMAKITSNLKL